MSQVGPDSEVVVELAEEFIDRYRRGERPRLAEYTSRYPHLKARIEDVFPAMAMMENIAIRDGSDDDSASADEEERSAHPPSIGDYRIVREVGRGGMGIVYEAEQLSLGRRVALKVLPQQMLFDRKHKRRFEREAKAAARLHHTNIVPVFGVGEQDGLHYYVMQFIQGLGLDEVIGELQRMREASQAGKAVSQGELRVSRRGDEVSAGKVARSLMTGEFERTILTEDDEAADEGPGRPGISIGDGRPGTKWETNGPAAQLEVQQSGAGATEMALASSGLTDASAGRLSDSFTLSGSFSLPGQSDASGSTSGSRARRKQTFWTSAAHIGQQVASALQYAHEQGIMHRDIKPSNLLLDMQGTVWITDFGLAKASDQQDITHTGDILGTLRYMPPEAFEGRSDARGDQYSLGLTLYELLVQKAAFSEKDRHKLIKLVTTSEPARVENLNPDVPRDLATIVHKAIDRDPSRRYASARDLADDLQRFLDDEPIRARRISPAERVTRWSRRNKGLAASLAAVCLLLLVVNIAGPVMTWRLREEKKKLQSRESELSVAVTKLKTRELELEDAGRQLQEETERANLKAGEAIRTRNASRLQLAESLLDRGLKLAEDGEVNEGLHWMLESLRVAPDEADRLRYVVRVNLASFSNQVNGLRHIEGFSRRPYCVALSPDGKTLVVGSIDGLHLYQTDSWERVGNPIACGLTFSVAFSPDGRTILSGHNNGDVRRWEVATGRSFGPAVPRHGGPVRCVAFNGDGGSFATGCDDGSARLWDSATGENRSTFKHDKPVRGIAFSPDGKTLLTGTGELLDEEHAGRSITGAAYLWDTHEETLIGDRQQVTWPILSVGFNPNGGSAAFGSDDWTLYQWNTWNGSPAVPVLRHHGAITHIQFDPSGTQIAVGGGYNAVLWDTVSGSQIGTKLWHPGVIYGVSFDPQGGTVVTAGGEETIRSWELCKSLSRPARKWARRERTPPTISGGSRLPDYLLKKTIAYNLDRNIALTSNGESIARLWDTMTGRPVGPPLEHPADRVQTVALSPQGDIAATGTYRGTICLWNSQGRLLHTIQWSSNVSALAFSPDGTLLASGTGGVVQLWDVKTGGVSGEALPQGGGTIFSLAFSPDGRTLAGGNTGAAALWDVASRRLIGKRMPHKNWVAYVSFSTDGRMLLTCSHDRTARVWNAATGEPITDPLPHKGLSRAVFHPNSKVVATGGNDGRVRLWDVNTGRPLPGATLVRDEPVTAVAFSPDGNIVGVGYEDGSARLWDAVMSKPLGAPLVQRYPIKQVSFLPDGSSFLTTAEDGNTRIWQVPRPLDGSLEQITLRLQVRTGMYMDSGGDISLLPLQEWNERRQQLITQEGSVENAYEFSVDDLAWHDARARDAEQDGNSFAEVWHLDHLISARPDDWFLLARRGRAHTRAGQFSDADLDYGRAARLAPESELRDWLCHQLLECEQYQHDEAMSPVEAERPYQRLEDVDTWGRLYLAYAARDDSTRAADWFARALERTPVFAARRELVERIVRLQPDLEELRTLRPDDPLVWGALANRQAAEGQTDAAAVSLARARMLSEALLAESPGDEALAGYLAALLLTDATRWTVLNPTDMTSAGGATLTRQDDDSILASGKNRTADVYTMRGTVDLPEVRAIRLEALPDSSLPRQGPGRHSSGNFQLKEFRVFAASTHNGESDERLPISAAAASYEYNYADVDIRGTIDDVDPRMWHVFGRPGEHHEAVFRLATPVPILPGQELIVQCTHTDLEAGINLGRFRLSVTDDKGAFERSVRRYVLSRFRGPCERLGAAYVSLGQFTEAAKWFARALEQAPGFAARLQLVKQIDELQADPGDLVALRPEDPLLWGALAMRQASAHQSEAAAESFARARSLTEALLANSPNDQALIGFLDDLRLADTLRSISWTVPEPITMTSRGGATLERQSDGSIFVSGENPDEDLYTIVLPLTSAKVTALRLETLVDERLPFGASGRSPLNGNFHLGELSLSLRSASDPSVEMPLPVTWAHADVTGSEGRVIGRVLDRNRTTQWTPYPQQNRNHVAVFQFQTPPGVTPENVQLVVRLDTGSSGWAKHGLGRFRLSVTDDALALK